MVFICYIIILGDKMDETGVFQKLNNKWENISTTRQIVAIGLLLLIQLILLLVALNFNSIYTKYENYTYPSGCTEEYKNGELISEECTYDRNMLLQSRGIPVFTIEGLDNMSTYGNIE